MKKFPRYSILRKYALSADTFIHLSQVDSRETPRFQTGIRRHTTLPVALYVALHAALPGPHSTVCSDPFRTSYYLIKAYARRAIYRLQAGASVSVTPTFYLPRCMTTPYANLPITDSSGRKYADRGITLPQLLPGAFKEVYRRRAVPACIVLPHSLLCSFFHISVFHSNLRQAGDLQTEGCRRQSVIPTFYLLHCMTAPYTNIPITDSPGKKCGDIAMQ